MEVAACIPVALSTVEQEDWWVQQEQNLVGAAVSDAMQEAVERRVQEESLQTQQVRLCAMQESSVYTCSTFLF